MTYGSDCFDEYIIFNAKNFNALMLPISLCPMIDLANNTFYEGPQEYCKTMTTHLTLAIH